MDALHAATALSDLNMPGWSVHPLKGNREGRHAMAVSGPWRITFRWDGKDGHDQEAGAHGDHLSAMGSKDARGSVEEHRVLALEIRREIERRLGFPPRDVLNMMIQSVDVQIGRTLAQHDALFLLQAAGYSPRTVR